MTDADVIIIGGGAAALMAARTLSSAGKKVMILEARNRLGGRIHTLQKPFAAPAEAGAEFIHGNLPVTIGLLQEAGIPYRAISGDIWRFMHGRWKKENDFIENGHELMSQLESLQQDIPVGEFLDRHFTGPQYNNLRTAIKGYIEGYDSGDLYKASAFALREEWSGEAPGDQYRVDGGYGRLIDFLADACLAAGCTMHLNATVNTVQWQPKRVSVVVTGNKTYTACQALVTVPLGVLQAEPGSEGAIAFSPALPEKGAAVREMGFGNIIKILMQFDDAFWTTAEVQRRIRKDFSNAGWLFSNQLVPTWWTQLPVESTLITGWLGGPDAKRLQYAGDKAIVGMAVETLSVFFDMSTSFIQDKLVVSQVVNWPAQPFTRGAYAYATCDTGTAIDVLASPVASTLFFAGEALHKGAQMGTVEGALASGKKAAEQMNQ